MTVSSTFVSGQVFTATDANLMANSGLTYITDGSLSSTTTDFTSVFSATYDSYRIVISSIALSATGDIYWRLLSGSTPLTTATYQWALTGITVGGGASNSTAAAQTIGYTGVTNDTGVAGEVAGSVSIDLHGPFLSQRTLGTSASQSFPTDWAHRTGYIGNMATGSYNGIRFLTNAGPTMTGRVFIYGYRRS